MEGAGAAETGEDVVMGVGVEEGVAVITPTPTIPTIVQTIKIRIKTKAKAKISNKQVQKLTREVPNIRISLPVLAGPVLSTGREDAELRTVLIPWSASGSRS